MSNIEEDYNLFQLVKTNPINSCIDLSKNMIGKKRGVFYFTERFRIDFENKMSDFERLKAEREQDKKIIKELEAKLEFKKWGDLDNTQFEEYINQFIPKQKVKDKIEHYKELQNNYIKKYDEVNDILQGMVNVLKQLLEEK